MCSKEVEEVEDIDLSCIAFAPFICLKVKRPSQITRPIPNTTVAFIALNSDTGIFKGLDLLSGRSSIVSGDRAQDFQGESRGGGLGIIVRIRYKST